MRLVFAGTPGFAARALAALLDAGHEVPLVLTQPDRPAGRGLRPAPSAVKQLASERGVEVYQPRTLKDEEALGRLEGARADVLVVAAYGLLLPLRALSAGRHGALNIHASLLPRWRGAAPIQRALMAGDRETGITIMQMDEGLDTGPVLARHALAIDDGDDAGTLHDKLAALGAHAIVLALADVTSGRVKPEPQPASGASYAPKISKEDSEIVWDRPSAEIERQIRALRPAPGARTELGGVPIKVWRAHCSAGSSAPGTVLHAGADGIEIACADRSLTVTELQRAGGRRLAVAEFLRGCPIAAGDRLGPAR